MGREKTSVADFLSKPNLKTSRYAIILIKIVLVSNIVSLDCATATVEKSAFADPGAGYYRTIGGWDRSDFDAKAEQTSPRSADA